MRLFDFLDYQAERNPDRPLLVSNVRSLSYEETKIETQKLAIAMLGLGLKEGDRVAILSKNTVEYLIFYYACARIGVVCVPLNFRLAPAEWEFILSNSQAKFLLCEKEFLDPINSISSNLNDLDNVAYIGETEKNLSEFASTQSYTDLLSMDVYDDLLPTLDKLSSYISPEDTLYQMYTSGTTGLPKGVLISHQSVSETLHQLAVNTPSLLTGGEWVVVLPLFHAAAALHCFSGVHAGSTLYIEAEFSPFAFVELLINKKINIALTVPAMIQAVLDYVPNIEDYNFDSLEQFVYGASPINENTLRQAMKVFDCDFCQGYGATEATLAISMLKPEDHRKALDGQVHLLRSAGKPVLGTQITIRDAEGNILPVNENGEVCVKGPQVMQAYWKLDEATKSALRDGWLYTGDAGYLDEEGYLYLVDRIKDMIVSGGENIYPKEIETALLKHESVKDVAVIGVPSEKWGETPKAIIVLQEDAELDEEALSEHCRSLLASYKCPSSYDAIDALPLNPTGKVLKKVLKAPYWENKDRVIA